MESRMTNPVAIVTGGTSGIGCATALELARRGYTVAAVGRDADRLMEITRQPEGTPGRIHGYAVDLLPRGSATELVDDVLRHHGRIDALVNGAGVLRAGTIDEMTDEDYDDVMDINVRVVFELCRAAAPALRASEHLPAIVNVSSVTGTRPYANLSLYCMSKAAIDHLTRSLAIELAPDGVRVNAVNPGVVQTALHRRGGMDEGAYESFLGRAAGSHPLGRIGRAEEIARVVAFLLGPDAGWITGETLHVDGGRHLTSLR